MKDFKYGIIMSIRKVFFGVGESFLLLKGYENKINWEVKVRERGKNKLNIRVSLSYDLENYIEIVI